MKRLAEILIDELGSGALGSSLARPCVPFKRSTLQPGETAAEFEDRRDREEEREAYHQMDRRRFAGRVHPVTPKE